MTAEVWQKFDNCCKTYEQSTASIDCKQLHHIYTMDHDNPWSDMDTDYLIQTANRLPN